MVNDTVGKIQKFVQIERKKTTIRHGRLSSLRRLQRSDLKSRFQLPNSLSSPSNAHLSPKEHLVYPQSAEKRPLQPAVKVPTSRLQHAQLGFPFVHGCSSFAGPVTVPSPVAIRRSLRRSLPVSPSPAGSEEDEE
ncbi:UNVERIFIED_CONTAM: hypothetical protein Sindi_1300100 [Sesamum indicum]